MAEEKFYSTRDLIDIKISSNEEGEYFIYKKDGTVLSPIKEDVFRHIFKIMVKEEIAADAKEIADLYAEVVKPVIKDKAHMKRNLNYWLTKHTKDELIKSIYNYRKVIDFKGTERAWRISPRNFFGKRPGNERFLEFMDSSNLDIKEEGKEPEEYQIFWGKPGLAE